MRKTLALVLAAALALSLTLCGADGRELPEASRPAVSWSGGAGAEEGGDAAGRVFRLDIGGPGGLIRLILTVNISLRPLFP